MKLLFTSIVSFIVGYVSLATIYVWFHPDGSIDYFNIPDGSPRIIIGPAPTPHPRIVHPTIVPVGTPSPDARRRLPL